jgi:translation initiation factor eIF-2B subunit delta
MALLSNISIEMDKDIARRISEIKYDSIHGADWLTRAALSLMIDAVKDCATCSKNELVSNLAEVAESLKNARPSMIGILNLTQRYMRKIKQLPDDFSDFGNQLILDGRELLDEYEASIAVATENAVENIEHGERILTCSYSSAVCSTFQNACGGSKKFTVLVMKSFYGGIAYGDYTWQQLHQYGITTELVEDNSISSELDINKAIVGADAILRNGSLVNGFPSNKLAKFAQKSKIPFFPICTTTKFDYLGQLNENKIEKAFEVIPADLLTGVITEEGIMTSDDVMKYIKHQTND